MLSKSWWYYTVEREDGGFHQGIYPDDMMLLPRANLAKVDLRGRKALDICTMEGLIPTLMQKGGAAEVVATDSARPSAYPRFGTDSIEEMAPKIDYVRALTGTNWRYEVIPEMTPVSRHLLTRGFGQFDFVNLSGLLYHVFSPMHWLGAIRPLIRDGGLAMISTNVAFYDSPVMLFNEMGSLQQNLTTYWYPTISLFDYLLRYFRLMPIDMLYTVWQPPDKGHASVLCRAVPDVIADPGDDWMRPSAWQSWDSMWYGGLELAGRSQTSDIGFKAPFEEKRIRLHEFMKQTPETPYLGHARHTAMLRRTDVE
jgi:2-polyprenyl-3-methyl-5-hydroxy-6-metoxy-1,4-benzoquinol methylase